MKTTKLTDNDSPPLKECDLNIDVASLQLHKMKEKQLPTVPDSLVPSFRVGAAQPPALTARGTLSFKKANQGAAEVASS